MYYSALIIRDRYSHAHFRDEEIEAQGLSGLPKVTQLKKNNAGVQIQVFGFHAQVQVQILGSFQCSTVWDMLIDLEMSLCGWIQQPPVNRNLETGREIITGNIGPESPAEVVVEASLAHELLLERMEG